MKTETTNQQKVLLEFELTKDEQLQAEKEGWGIFYTGTQDACHNLYELQRQDESEIFPDDTLAQMHVISLADNYTNGIHAKAMRFLAKHSPNELDYIMRECSPVPFDNLLKKLNIHL